MWLGGSEGCSEKNCILILNEGICMKLFCSCQNVVIFFEVINVHGVDTKRQFKLSLDKLVRCNGDYWLKNLEIIRAV
jgi:hypothetical protein